MCLFQHLLKHECLIEGVKMMKYGEGSVSMASFLTSYLVGYLCVDNCMRCLTNLKSLINCYECTIGKYKIRNRMEEPCTPSYT